MKKRDKTIKRIPFRRGKTFRTYHRDDFGRFAPRKGVYRMRGGSLRRHARHDRGVTKGTARKTRQRGSNRIGGNRAKWWGEHRPLVDRIVNRRLRVLGVPRNSDLGQDLKQEGMIALWLASKKHDPRRGKFETFATHHVKGAVGRALKRQAAFGPGEREVRKILKAGGELDRRVSLDAISGHSGGTGERGFARRRLEQIHGRLSPRERRVVFGVAQGEKSSRIARELRISNARVSQILTSARNRLSREAA